MATEMLAAGIPIATVSQRLSHARASTTLNVYAHSVPGGDRVAAETLSAIVANFKGCEDRAVSIMATSTSDGPIPTTVGRRRIGWESVLSTRDPR